ncbi:hypothetical protein EV426DRAFT_252037 [Tirmania nivea]|nr:hypothetical protein EV426DRAFT_252037 [Tirmania nivea]
MASSPRIGSPHRSSYRDRDRRSWHYSRSAKSPDSSSRSPIRPRISELPLHVSNGDINAFLSLLGDVLRLPEETISMTHIYLNRYLRWHRTTTTSSSPPAAQPTSLNTNSPTNSPPLLDQHTLALASLSLSTKSTECPRRLRDILLPAYHILHPPPHNPPLTYPSHKYDALRHTIVQAELILLRALAFGIHQSPVAYEYLPRLVSKILNSKVYGGGLYSPTVGGMEDWDTYTPGEAEECGVVEIMQTGLAKRAKFWVGRASQEYLLVNFYTMRTVAVASVWLGMKDVGWGILGDSCEEDGAREREGKLSQGIREWVEQITSGRVDPEEFWEVLEILEGSWKGESQVVVP